MQVKDSATIAYSVEPQMLTVSILKDEVMDILKSLAKMKLIKLETNLSTIELDYIDWNGKKLHFKNYLVLTPKLDDTKQLYTIDYPKLGLIAFAYTRQELIEDIKSDIVYLWEEYALASNNELTEDAKQLKNELLELIEVK
ncbi:hypothetical protein R83H12_01092 [Fibrobacteria bacterium R8-3-H12]